MAKMRFVVEVEAIDSKWVLQSHPPTQQQVANCLLSHIREGSGYYAMFNYNTVKVEPLNAND